MSDPTDEILARIGKLLRHADRNQNENEASNAMALAQKLADAYNLDIEDLRKRGVDTHDKKREDNKFGGGLYRYQRTLYEQIATLNHCLYWSHRGITRGSKYEHRIVGSKINVLLTRQMAEYLEATIERLAREWAGSPSKYFTKQAHSYRDGLVDRITGRLRQQRREEKAERDRENAKRGPSGGTQLVTIDDVAAREAAANYDFQYGEGAWERAQQRAAEWQRKQREAREAADKWERENPEAAAEAKAKAHEEEAKRLREEARRAARRKTPVYTGPKYKGNLDAYYSGYDKGADVSLNRQVDKDDIKSIA